MQTFEAVVSVLDKATGPLSKIETKLAGTMAPIARLKTGFVSLGETLGFAKISEAAEGAKAHINTLREFLGGLAGPLQMLAGVASIGGLMELTKRSTEAGAALYESSQKTGVAVDQLARLHYAATQTGASTETLDKGLEYLNRTIGDALSGKNKEMGIMFSRLGISLRDSAGHVRSAGAVYADLAEAVKRNKNSPVIVAEITKALSTRGGAELLPMLTEGAEGLQKFGDQYDQFHGKFTNKMAQDADSVNQSWGKLGTAVSGLSDTIGLSLGPKLQPAIDGMSNFIAAHREFVADMALSGVSLVGIATISSGPVLGALKGLASPWMKIGSEAIKGTRVAIGAFGNFVTAMRAGYGVMESLQLAFNGTALANPYVLAATIIVGAAVVVATHWEAFKNNSLAIWNFIKGGVTSAAQGIAAGFSRMGSAVIATWQGVKAAFMKIWDGITKVFSGAWAKLKPIVDPIVAAGEKLSGLLGTHGATNTNMAQRFRPANESAALSAAGVPNFGAPLQLARIPSAGAPGAPGRGGAGGAAGASGARGQVDVNVKVEGARVTGVSTRLRGDVSAPDVDVGHGFAIP